MYSEMKGVGVGSGYGLFRGTKFEFIINTNKTKYMQLTRKTNIIKQDIEVEEKLYEAVNQFIYLGWNMEDKNK